MAVAATQVSAFLKAQELFAAGEHDAAVSLISRLSEEEFAPAQHFLGWCYQQGVSLDVDLEMAFHWWLRAAKQGVPESQYAIGQALRLGWGCEMDRVRAAHWLTAAASSCDEPGVSTASEASRELHALQNEMSACERTEFEKSR